MSSDLEFEQLVARHYQPLYRFAFSLTRSEADACDLTQQTFYVWAAKGHQLREAAKVKTWLFSTLHHEFLNTRRRQTRFPHYELSEMEHELPSASSALVQVDEPFQAAVALFYLEECSYREIAEILGAPIGTVKSRLARGVAQLQKLLLNCSPPATTPGKVPHEA